MDIVFYLLSFSLISFMLLATYDGFYLHLWKYKLYQQEESTFEHKTHTVRAILFPLIVWSLLIKNSVGFFIFGIILTAIDLLVLIIDAYSEKDSRKFMGGLPRWEYIIHLFANGFHYVIIALTLAVKLTLIDNAIYFVGDPYPATFAFKLLGAVAENAIPGAVILAILHVLLVFPKTQGIWNHYRMKISCC